MLPLIAMLTVLAAAPDDIDDAPTPFRPVDVTLAFTVDAAGGVVACRTIASGLLPGREADCDDMDGDTLALLLGRPLAGYSEVDLHYALRIAPQSSPQPAQAASFRRVIAAMTLDTAADGAISCRTTTAAKFVGISIDFCEMLAATGGRFERAWPGEGPRRAELVVDMAAYGGGVADR